jgi:AcrR family transcriptional regulator
MTAGPSALPAIAEKAAPEVASEERRDTYHHGNLRQALIEAGLCLARSGGPEAVVLREVNRAAGVSHSAAYRHFPDRDSLLRAVCERAMGELARLIETRVADLPHRRDPQRHAWEALVATGRAYIEFAISEPGWFETAFSVPHGLDPIAPGEGCGETGRDPYQLLSGCLDELVATGALAPDRRPGAEIGPWAAVHGLATLLVQGPLRDMPPEQREGRIQAVVELVRRGL